MLVKNTLLQKTLFILILIYTSVQVNAQDEFMIYGVIQTEDNNEAGTRIKIENTKTYKTVYDENVEAGGQYRLDLAYGVNYQIFFTKEGYTPITFDVTLDLPEGVKECCYRALKLSFHLFKPDGEHDDLFKGSFYNITYEEKLKGFNYDLDIDYMVQQRIVNDAIFKQKKLETQEGKLARTDSIQSEKRYLALINQGTQFYNSQQFYTARKIFLEAKKIKPNRMYPQYKLEDIRTELERFETKANLLGVDVDSIIQKELAQAEIKVDNGPIIPPYVPLTPEQVEEIFRKDIEKQVIALSDNANEANRTLALMNELFDKEFEEVKIADITPTPTTPEVEPEPPVRTVDLSSPVAPTPIVVETPIIKPEPVIEVPKPVEPVEPVVEVKPTQTTIDTIKPEVVEVVEVKPIPVTPTPTPKPVEPVKPVVTTPTEKPTPVRPTTPPVQKFVPKVVDYKTYQDSLRQKYVETRTVEVSQDNYKKTTRVFMNNGQYVEVYAMVEHSWGATYYYIEEYPSGYQNIGYTAFMNKTKLYEITEKKPGTDKE